MEILDPAFLLLLLTHADPGVRHQDVGAVGRLHGVRGHQEAGAVLSQVARQARESDKTERCCSITAMPTNTVNSWLKRYPTCPMAYL